MLELHDGIGAWALSGFTATTVYLVITAAQAMLAERRAGAAA